MWLSWDGGTADASDSGLNGVLVDTLTMPTSSGGAPLVSLSVESPERPMMQVGLAGRHGMLYWPADRLYGTDGAAPPRQAVRFHVDARRSEIIRPSCLRLSAEGLLTAVHEYARTGQRPHSVRWHL